MILSWIRVAIRTLFGTHKSPPPSILPMGSQGFNESNVTSIPVSTHRQFKRYIQKNKKQVYGVMLRRFDEERHSTMNYITVFRLNNGSLLKIPRSRVSTTINKIYMWAISAEEYEMCKLCSILLPMYTTP